jgi:hypothetical protein
MTAKLIVAYTKTNQSILVKTALAHKIEVVVMWEI